MNEPSTTASNTTQCTEFVWRRLEEPLRLLGQERPWLWPVLLGVVLGVALFYVAWMYFKDSRGLSGGDGVAGWMQGASAAVLVALLGAAAYVIWTEAPVALKAATGASLWTRSPYDLVLRIVLLAGVGGGVAVLAVVMRNLPALVLGLLRVSVYAVLATIFLLPADQTYVRTQSESKVILLFDVSSSMGVSDELSGPGQKGTTRMDLVSEFLDGKSAFLAELEKKNPVTAYRFGSKLDEDYLHFAGGRVWTRLEKEKPERDEEGAVRQPEAGPLDRAHWTAWLNPALPHPRAGGLSEAAQLRLDRLKAHNLKMVVKEGLTRGTNIGDTTLAVLNKELNNRVQGIVLFTDGRNTESSPNAFRELALRAREAKIPLFVVGVGEDRIKVKLEVVDLRIPPQVQPEDKFRCVAEITGEGLAGEKVPAALEITHVKVVKVKRKDKAGKTVEEEKEEALPIVLVERDNPDSPRPVQDRAKVSLGMKLTLPAPSPVVLDKANTPRAEVEWQLDAAALAAAAKVELDKTKKWEIGQTGDDSELKYVVRVPGHPRERLKPKEVHQSERLGMRVTKRPVRVLLFAAAANRDYQFVQALLAREMEKKRLELAICLQPPPGTNQYRPGVVQSVPKERMLTYFPDTWNKKKDLYDLTSYDVIVCYDPDWNRLTGEQTKMLKLWAEKGGGLVVVGGYINTVELIRPDSAGNDQERFKPILDLLPVELANRGDLKYNQRKTDDPWRLDFSGATPEYEFLKLDEDLAPSQFTEDWQMFFDGEGKEKSGMPQRGFYNLYPVQKAKGASIVLARFTDPALKLEDKERSLHPYIVINPESGPRVVWIGSAETWRLREYREAYHERFWTKLVRFAAAKSKGAVTKAIRLEMGKYYIQNRYVAVEAKIDGPDGEPLRLSGKDKGPKVTLQMPPGVSEKEIKQPIYLSPRPGVRDGWFSGQFQVKSPGDYELKITVPRQPGQDSDEVETWKFSVKEANPELDNTRPDFDLLYRLASEADGVLQRMSNEGERAELKRRLQRPRPAADAEAGPGAGRDKVEIREDKARLFFSLKNAGLIPSCMIRDVQTQESRGPYKDRWDDGVVLYEYPQPEDPSKPGRKPVQLSYVLLVVVGLLSTEWLIRKLLRLA
jgi:hypothetical protein